MSIHAGRLSNNPATFPGSAFHARTTNLRNNSHLPHSLPPPPVPCRHPHTPPALSPSFSSPSRPPLPRDASPRDASAPRNPLPAPPQGPRPRQAPTASPPGPSSPHTTAPPHPPGRSPHTAGALAASRPATSARWGHRPGLPRSADSSARRGPLPGARGPLALLPSRRPPRSLPGRPPRCLTDSTAPAQPATAAPRRDAQARQKGRRNLTAPSSPLRPARRAALPDAQGSGRAEGSPGRGPYGGRRAALLGLPGGCGGGSGGGRGWGIGNAIPHSEGGRGGRIMGAEWRFFGGPSARFALSPRVTSLP